MIVLPENWKKYWNFKEDGLERLFAVKGAVFSESNIEPEIFPDLTGEDLRCESRDLTIRTLSDLVAT